MQKKSTLRGSALLAATALVWGFGFVAQSAGLAYLGPLTFNGARSLIAALALVPATVLAEVLTDTGRAGEGAWRTLHAHRVVEVLPFDERAAREQARLAGEGAALAVALKAASLDRRQLVCWRGCAARCC